MKQRMEAEEKPVGGTRNDMQVCDVLHCNCGQLNKKN